MARLLVIWKAQPERESAMRSIMYEQTKDAPVHHPAENVWLVELEHTPESLRDLLGAWLRWGGQVIVLDLATHHFATTGYGKTDEHTLQEVLGLRHKTKRLEEGRMGYGFGPEKPKHDPMWRMRHK